ncbi:MAG TPA: enoyl-CoA hydratase-related protein [Acidimicrobiia bacterium]
MSRAPEPAGLVLLESRPDGVAVLQLNRPPLNPLSTALMVELADHARMLAADPDVKAVVVTGSAKAFAAGADVAEFTADGAARRVSTGLRAGLDALTAIPRPVIAAINGFALGGGLELALACDVRVAGDSARLGFPEIQLGIFPGAGGTQRLPRLVGPARAKELIWSGRHVKAEEALALGLVDKVVPAEEVLEATLAWAAELASGPVVAMGIAKQVIDAGLDVSLSRGLDLEADGFEKVFATDDAVVGIRSFLADGPGKATFSGR